MRIRQSLGPVPVLSWPAGASLLGAGWARTQFRRTDDGAGGRFDTLRRGVKFWVRCVWNSRALALSNAAFRDSALDAIVETRPELALRPLRSYLRRGLGAERRALALGEHFAWLSRRLPMPTIDGLYTGAPLRLLDPDASPVDGLGLVLSSAGGQGREGELALRLEWRGEPVMSLAFSVVDAARVMGTGDPGAAIGPRIVIGALQGVRGADAALRELGVAAHRLRASGLLLLAVQALSAAWELQAPLGVAARSHVYAGYSSRRRQVALDYDAVWQEAGAERCGRHYWALPARPVLRPDSEVESRRRAQHRRRNALREGLFASLVLCTGALLA